MRPILGMISHSYHMKPTFCDVRCLTLQASLILSTFSVGQQSFGNSLSSAGKHTVTEKGGQQLTFLSENLPKTSRFL